MNKPKVGRNGVIQIGYVEPEEKYSQNIHDPNYIDFPCSGLWGNYYEEILYGRHPSVSISIPKKKEERPVVELTRIGRNEYQQLLGRVINIQGKVENILKARTSTKKKDYY